MPVAVGGSRMRCRWPDTPRRHLHAAGSPSCARAAAGDRSRPRRVVPRCRSPTDDARLRPLDGPGDLPAGGSWYSSPVQPAPCDSPEIRIGTRSSCRAAARCNPGLAECELDWLSRHQPTPRLARLRQILPVQRPRAPGAAIQQAWGADQAGNRLSSVIWSLDLYRESSWGSGGRPTPANLW